MNNFGIYYKYRKLYNSLVSGTVYLERVFEMMDVPPETTNAKDAFEIPPVKGEFIQNVEFGYENQAILKIYLFM